MNESDRPWRPQGWRREVVTTQEAGRSRRRRAVASVALAVAVLCACVAGPGTNGTPSPGAQLSGAGPVSHEYLPGLAAYPHLPQDRDRAPVVVMVPGGSWRTANPSGLGGLAQELAASGIVAMPVEIRAAQDGVVYPTPVENILCAVADGVATAEANGIEAGPVVVLGHSSGAHLSALAVLAAQDYSPRCPDPPVEPDALVGLAGPYDVRLAADLAEPLFGTGYETNPRLWDAGNPVLRAGLRSDVPVLLLHGDGDDVVPTSFTTEFAQALRQAGHPTTVRILAGVDHQDVYSASVAGKAVAAWVATLDR
jgi:acetyl esterase/lipase